MNTYDTARYITTVSRLDIAWLFASGPDVMFILQPSYRDTIHIKITQDVMKINLVEEEDGFLFEGQTTSMARHLYHGHLRHKVGA